MLYQLLLFLFFPIIDVIECFPCSIQLFFRIHRIQHSFSFFVLVDLHYEDLIFLEPFNTKRQKSCIDAVTIIICQKDLEFTFLVIFHLLSKNHSPKRHTNNPQQKCDIR